MTKKNIVLIIGAGYLQIESVKAAHELGYLAYVADKNPQAPAIEFADRYFQISTKDIQGHVALAKKLKDRGLSAVFCAAISEEVTAAHAARAVGLLGVDPEIALKVSDKATLRTCLSEAGILQPKFRRRYNHTLAVVAADEIGYPVIVKPTNSSGSRGVTKIYKKEEFTVDVFLNVINQSGDNGCIVEELLSPLYFATSYKDYRLTAEQSVETLWENGKCFPLNQVDRQFFIETGKYAIEIGHFNPSLLPPKKLQENYELVERAGEALRFTDGILKADIMQTEKGTVILEMTCRLSGGFDSTHTSPLAHGVKYIRGAMRMALGEPIPWEDFMPKWYRHAVAMSKFPNSGKVTAINGIESAMEVSGVEHVIPRVKIGDVIPPYVNCVSRPLFVITSGDTRERAIAAAEEALNKIQIQTEPV